MPVFNAQLFENTADGKQKLGPAVLAKEGPFFEVLVAIPQPLAEFYTKTKTPLLTPIAGIALVDTAVVGVDLSGQTIGGQQLIALLGRDVLAMGMFIYNGSTGSYSFAI